MKSAVTLIELLISVVIIAIVFSVIPKIIYATNKSFINAGKQDGIFNAVELMHTIASSPWDKGSYETYGILNVNDGYDALDCNASGYRIGGFIGGRNCLDVERDATAEQDFGDLDLLSIDWFHTKDINASSDCTPNEFNATVKYKKFEINGNDIDLTVIYDNNISDTNSSNIKHINLQFNPSKNAQSGCIDFDYYSANLGQIGILKKEY
jgi:prepilin-type N-terminal cleavage/methylation domain-containing protein